MVKVSQVLFVVLCCLWTTSGRINRGISPPEVTKEKCQSGTPQVDRRPSGYFGFAKTDDYQCRYTFRPLDADKGVVMAMNVVYANDVGESGQDIVLPGGKKFPYINKYDAIQDYKNGINCYHLVRGNPCTSAMSRRFCQPKQVFKVPQGEEFTFKIPRSSWKFVVYYQFFECDGSEKGGFTETEKVTKPSVFILTRKTESSPTTLPTTAVVKNVTSIVTQKPEKTTESREDQTKESRHGNPHTDETSTNTLSIVLGTTLFVVSLLLMIVLFTKRQRSRTRSKTSWQGNRVYEMTNQNIATLNEPKNQLYSPMEDDPPKTNQNGEIPKTPLNHRAPIPQPRSKPQEGTYLAPLTKQDSDEIYAEIPGDVVKIPPVEKPPRSRRVPTAYGVGNFKK